MIVVERDGTRWVVEVNGQELAFADVRVSVMRSRAGRTTSRPTAPGTGEMSFGEEGRGGV